jgi:hypothetical protein
MSRAACVVSFAVLLSLALVAGAQTSEVSAEALRMEMVFWESVRNSTDPADLHAYLEQYPNGKFAALARNRLAALEPKPAAAAPAAPAPAPQANVPQPPRVDPGALAVGDAWTYRVARRGSERAIHEVKLASVTPESIVEEILGHQGAVQRAEHRKGSYLMPVGELTLFSPYLFSFGLPPMPGLRLGVDNLDSRICNAGWTCSVSARVVGRDRVQVPAGTFDATKVEISQSWTSPFHPYERGEMVSRTLTVWYAPEVKRAVKFVSRGTPSRFIDTEFDLELVKYQLN